MRAEVPPPHVGAADQAATSSSMGGIGRDVALTYLTPLATAATSLLLLGYAIRHVGTTDYGLFAVLASVIALVTMVDYSLSTSVVRSAAQRAAAGDETAHEVAEMEMSVAHSALVALGGCVALIGLPIAVLLPSVVRVPSGRESAFFVCAVLVSLAAGFSLATAAIPGAARGCRHFGAVAVSSLSGAGSRVVLVILLAPRLQLVALGVAQVASVLVDRLLIIGWARRHLPWFPLRPRRFTLASARRVAVFAAPLFLFAIDYQVVTSSDAIVIGALAGPSAVAAYRVGAIIPIQGLVLLATAWTAILPALAGAPSAGDQVALMRFATRILSYVGAICFGVTALFREDLVQLLLGRSDPLAEGVLLLFSVTFAVHLGLHGLFMLLVARNRQHVVAFVVPVELTINLSLTVILVGQVGPWGAALAAAVSYGLSDLILFPFLARREFVPTPGRLIATDSLVPAALGAAVCFLSTLAVRLVLGPSPGRLVLAALLAAGVGGAAGLLALGSGGRAHLVAAVRT